MTRSTPPEVTIRGNWLTGVITIDGDQILWPVKGVSWSMNGPEEGAVPVLTLQIECSRIQIDHEGSARYTAADDETADA